MRLPWRRSPPSLFWRVFAANTVVFVVAGLALALSPATIKNPITLPEATMLAAGIAVMLLVNLAFMRKAFSSLNALALMMRQVDPLKPGQRIALPAVERELADLVTSFNDMLDRLERERRESAHRELQAQDAEQRRIAGELHDEVGQQLTVLLLVLANAQADASAETARELQQARDLTHVILDSLRGVVRRLRPETLDELGITRALDALAHTIQQHTGVTIHRRLHDVNGSLSPVESLVVYRIAQETLTNAVRHAPGAPIDMELAGAPDRSLQLRITDHGPGFASHSASNGGAGLRLMAERALLIGGTLEVDSSSTGTTVTLTMPKGQS